MHCPRGFLQRIVVTLHPRKSLGQPEPSQQMAWAQFQGPAMLALGASQIPFESFLDIGHGVVRGRVLTVER